MARRGGLVVIVLALAGLALLFGLSAPKPAPKPAPKLVPKPAPISASKPAAPDYDPLKRQVQGFLDTRPAKFGVFFKDLTSGATFGINEGMAIPAASTQKVPIVLYLNQLVAQGKVDFSERVAYDAETDYQTGAGILQYTAREGDTYSLRVLANLAITISDNVATRMLIRRLGKENIARFMRDLGGTTVYPEGKNLSSARDMAAYVEAVLAFAREEPRWGERLLDDMSHSIYHVGLPGELPPGIRVAHKEGDLVGVADDVGVVFSRRPFILCVLSEGVDDLDAGFRDIARISRMVYEFQEGLAGK